MKTNKRKIGYINGILMVILISLVAILANHIILGNEQIIPPVGNGDKSTNNSNNITASPSIPASLPAPAITAEISDKADIILLVNKDHKLPDDYKPDLVKTDREKVAEVLLDDLQEMRKAAEKERVYLYIANAYRTKTEQERIFNQTVDDYINNGNSPNAAVEKAKYTAALPGYSEHETGLAIDFSFNGNADKQADMWNWLSNNAYKYGFILRYPEGKENITGYSYEPWHFRYVGKQHARAIYEQGLVLEEYLNTLP